MNFEFKTKLLNGDVSATREQLIELIEERADVSRCDVSQIADFSSLFEDVRGDDNEAYFVDLSQWDVSNGIVFDKMFKNAFIAGTEDNPIDFSKWDMSNASYMNQMFYNFKAYDKAFSSDLGESFKRWIDFESAGINQWQLDNALNCEEMFFFKEQSAFNLKSVDLRLLEHWNFKQFECKGMFYGQDIVRAKRGIFEATLNFNDDPYILTNLPSPNSFIELGYDNGLTTVGTIDNTDIQMAICDDYAIYEGYLDESDDIVGESNNLNELGSFNSDLLKINLIDSKSLSDRNSNVLSRFLKDNINSNLTLTCVEDRYLMLSSDLGRHQILNGDIDAIKNGDIETFQECVKRHLICLRDNEQNVDSEFELYNLLFSTLSLYSEPKRRFDGLQERGVVLNRAKYREYKGLPASDLEVYGRFNSKDIDFDDEFLTRNPFVDDDGLEFLKECKNNNVDLSLTHYDGCWYLSTDNHEHVELYSIQLSGGLALNETKKYLESSIERQSQIKEKIPTKPEYFKRLEPYKQFIELLETKDFMKMSIEKFFEPCLDVLPEPKLFIDEKAKRDVAKHEMESDITNALNLLMSKKDEDCKNEIEPEQLQSNNRSSRRRNRP